MNTLTYKPIIGLEIHAQLLTETKMFSPEENSYNAVPNSCVSCVTAAHPGTMPYINQQAIEYTLKLGIACGAYITKQNYFARKNYFYPDLPKGYQITQDATPLCYGGSVKVDLQEQGRKIALKRIHLEEDTGKSLYNMLPQKALLDFNRAGIPLIEIVTEPVMHTAEEAMSVLKEIRKLLRYLEICNGNMEEGSLRCDANISIMVQGSSQLNQKVEVKNMNSITNVKHAIEYEVKRQIECTKEGKAIQAETRYYDPDKRITLHMRLKESNAEYKYFPDPDLSPFEIHDSFLEKVKKDMPTLPDALFKKFTHIYGLSNYEARLLIEDKYLALFFEEVCQETNSYKILTNFFIGPVKAFLKKENISVQEFPLAKHTIVELIELIHQNQLSFSLAMAKVYPILLEEPSRKVIEIAEKYNLIQNQDDKVIRNLVQKVLDKYPEKVKAYHEGKKGLLGFFIGEVMRVSKQAIDPKVSSRLLNEMLAIKNGKR